MSNLDALYDRLRAELPGLELRRGEPMREHTTFKVGGPAALMALPASEEELVAAVKLAAELGARCVCIGNGSNLLVDDAGVDAFLVKTTGLDRCDVREDGVITAGAGILLSQLAERAADASLAGLEFAQGIPGTLGGGVFMNAGAYSGELAQVITSVRALGPDGAVRTFSNAECDFAYRHSAFSGGEWVILSAGLKLVPGNQENIRAQMEKLAARRRAKQPLKFPSAGSTFKRPKGFFAAALIDQCGLKRATVGGAQVSSKHAGFIINLGGATCADILALMDLVRERVLADTGVELEPEVRYLK